MSSFKVWLLAIRPKTLPAAVAPVLVGSAKAFADDGFQFLPAVAAMTGALLLQIGVNLSNDYFDFKRGIDTQDRLGPVRVTQSGLISPQHVFLGVVFTFLLSCLVGLYLIFKGGWPIVVIGLASISAALAYSGGPYPLASHGLGDITVFIFFGLVAVGGTYYVQALTFGREILSVSIPMGLLITAILVVNNLRDIKTDCWANKLTLAVKLGEKGTRKEYSALLAVSYLWPLILIITVHMSLWVLLPLLSMPYAIKMIKDIYKEEGSSLNNALAGTAKLTLIYAILFSTGLSVQGPWGA